MARRKRTKVSMNTLVSGLDDGAGLAAADADGEEADGAGHAAACISMDIRMLRRSAKLVVGKLVQRLDRQGWPLQGEKEWLVFFDALKDPQRMDAALVLALMRQKIADVNKMRDECTAALPADRRLALEVARVTARALYAADRAERMRIEADGS